MSHANTVSLASKLLLRWLIRRPLRYLVRNLSQYGGLNRFERLNNFIERRLSYKNYALDFNTETIFNFRIIGNTTDLIQRYIYLYGVWEPNLSYFICTRLRSGDTFVDVGANVGYFSLLASKAVGSGGRVVSIEASPTIFRQLERNVASNKAVNVRTVCMAASDRPGILTIFRAPNCNIGETSWFKADGFIEEGVVAARPLYEILSPSEIAGARIIKIDVEGAEVAVIHGLLPCLAAMREDLEIVVEVGGGPPGSPSASLSSRQIVTALADFGFHSYELANDYGAKTYFMRSSPARPRRIQSGIDRLADLVFSRIDNKEL